MEMERRDSDTRRLQHVAAARSVDALLAAMVLASRSPAGRRRLLGVPAISYRGVQPSLGTDPGRRVVSRSAAVHETVSTPRHGYWIWVCKTCGCFGGRYDTSNATYRDRARHGDTVIAEELTK